MPQLPLHGMVSQVRHGETQQTLGVNNLLFERPFFSYFQAASNMQQFMRSNALSPMVMVCTDRSSRGMDFDRAEASFVSDESTR